MNGWLRKTAEGLSDQELSETVSFTFVGGGEGATKQEEIFLHLFNHATHHRAFVST